MKLAGPLVDGAGHLLDRAAHLVDEQVAHWRGRDHWGEAAAAPTRGIGAVAHWRVPGREGYFVATLRALLAQAPDMAVGVFTNEPDEVAAVLTDAGVACEAFRGDEGVAGHLLGGGGRVAVVRWGGLEREHPFRLTWAHKRLFRELVVDHDAFAAGLSHLVYIEDDLALAPGALDYWCEMRPVLEPHGLIPAFTRSEGPDDDLRLTSPVRPHRIDELRGFALPVAPGAPERRVLGMHFPYQGFYVLDAPLARYHFTCSSFRSVNRSKLSGTLGGTWAVRERAAAGAIFDRVPAGYRSRNVLLLERTDGEHLVPVERALVRHLPANYYADPASKKATVPVVGAFVG